MSNPQKKLIVQVEEAHIEDGNRNHLSQHPLALALEDFFPESSWHIGRGYAMLMENHIIKEMWEISPEGRDFVRQFNAGEKVEPVAIELTLTDL